jgi:predicted nucleic acid-binding protein
MAALRVVDASAALRVLLWEPGWEAAEVVLRPADDRPGPAAVVPDLFYLECGNTLRRSLLRRVLSETEVRERVREVLFLEFEVVPTRAVLERAFALAAEHRISFFDACYVAVAEQYRAPLVTADARLQRALAGTRHRVELLPIPA